MSSSRVTLFLRIFSFPITRRRHYATRPAALLSASCFQRKPHPSASRLPRLSSGRDARPLSSVVVRAHAMRKRRSAFSMLRRR